MEWSDIRVFLQVVRAGTMAAATSALHLDHSTISRRISRLEREAGVPLFERAGRRLALTSEGDKLVSAAERLESIVIREIMSLSGEQQQIGGHVRIGTTEDFGVHYLGSRLSDLTANHAELEIELVAQPRAFSLPTREVDLVVTLDRPITGDVRFKKLTDFHYGVYANARFLDTRDQPSCLDDLAEETWCGYIQELLSTSQLDLLPSDTGKFTSRYRTTNVSVQLAAVLGGCALAALPCFVATPHALIERLLPQAVALERTYWLAVHEDMAKYPRVRAVMKALEAIVDRDRDLFLPGRSHAPMASRDYEKADGDIAMVEPVATMLSSSVVHRKAALPTTLPA